MKARHGIPVALAVVATTAYWLIPVARVGAVQASTGTGRIVASVVFTGTPPAPTRLQLNADPVCVKKHPGPAFSQIVEVGDNGALKGSLVYVKDGLNGTYPVPTTPVVLDQVACAYAPHILGVMAGQTVQIVNSDPTLHNVHPQPVTNTGFNIGMPVEGMKYSKVFPKAEAPFPVKCDVHSWMSAYIAVFNHPFFGVSNARGQVELANLPAGTFQIQAWHEKYGVRTQTVTLGPGETKTITFTFKA